MKHNICHDTEIYRSEIEPDLLKKINQNLTISLSYLNQDSPDNTECLISFHNTSDENIHINPVEETSKNNEGDTSWYSKFFGSTDTEQTLIEHCPTNELKIFLGYIQLFGYVMLNYQLDLENSSSLLENSKNMWWYNKDYINDYHDYANELPDDLKELKLNNIPFIRKNLNSPLVIGGKLGGVSDLSMKNKVRDTRIESENKYLINDLIYIFNSQEYKDKENYDSNEFISSNELLNSIIPIYSTPQDLLFTDLRIAPASTKTYHIKFPKLKNLPPSYNTRSTGPVCDQGLVSIKYSLIVGLSLDRGLKPISVYFPMYLKPERAGMDKRWLQRKYNDEVIFDSKWKVNILSSQIEEVAHSDPAMEIFESRNDLLESLSKLIISDLHDLPKISHEIRHKSIGNIETEYDENFIPQLPNHLKTQYQIRLNKDELCLINLTKPYYHIGEDINFTININPSNVSTTKVVGFITYLEACEQFELNKDNEITHINYYKVTPSLKINCFASSMINSESESVSSSYVSGYLNVPKFLTSQFQYSDFMSLKYYLVFKFNLIDFYDEEIHERKQKNGNDHSYTQTDRKNVSLVGKNTNSDINIPEHTESINYTANEELTNITNPSIKSHVSSHNSSIIEPHFLDFAQHYKHYNEGNEMRFRLPIVLLP